MPLLTYKEMLKTVKEYGRPAVLLGNGFSRAWDDDRFRYDRLFEDADLSKRVRDVFEVYGTRDFEAAMRALRQARKIVRGYTGTRELRQEMLLDIRAVRDALLTAIKEHHPEDPGMILEEEYESCARFLSRFESIFTTNYDLLLYWVLNWAFKRKQLLCFEDGFRQPYGQPHLLWKRENAETQNVHFIHGAFHILDTEPYPIKLSWKLKGQSILDQVSTVIADGDMPLFVSEGDGPQKLRTILRNPYLSYAYGALQDNSAPLVLLGIALTAADSHILDAIVLSDAPALFVGVHDSASAEEQGRLRDMCTRLRQRRWGRTKRNRRAPELSTALYATSGWKVWR